MRNAIKTALAVGTLTLLAAPAFAVGPGTGLEHRPDGLPHSGTDNPGTDNRPATTPPASKRALGRVCADQGASRSNEGDPDAGTPFSRCVRSLARAIRSACKDESRSNANDPERGTPRSRCIVDLARGLQAGTATTDRGLARGACKRPDFDSGREYGACVKRLATALREA